MTTPRIPILLLALVPLLAGCRNKARAQSALEDEGYTDVVLTPSGKEGFTFTAKKGEDDCTGSVVASGLGGNTNTQVTASCAPPVPVCGPGTPSGCFKLGLALEKTDASKATALYQTGCDLGDIGCCNNLGVAYDKGLGVPEDDAKAFTLYQRACKGGNDQACVNQAISLRDGLGVTAAPADAVPIFAASCTGKNAASCSDLAQLYWEGVGVPKDASKARQYATIACNGKSDIGCSNLGYFLVVGPSPEVEKGAALMSTACEKKIAIACKDLGLLMRKKTIPDPDHRMAALDDQACDLEDSGGCFESGVLWDLGLGGRAKDDAKALAQYDRACALGSPNGCFNVGIMTSSGRGGPKDKARAALAYKKGCTLGSADSCAKAKQLGSH